MPIGVLLTRTSKNGKIRLGTVNTVHLQDQAMRPGVPCEGRCIALDLMAFRDMKG
jgi:hypothetical protein